MQAVKHGIDGRLLAENGRFALLLFDPEPGPETAVSLYLRYAFLTQGAEEPLFPAFILDDWGGEIKSLSLYDWFDEFAVQFPRAELFGFDGQGRPTQRFLRELELFSQWVCYAYSAPDTPLAAGVLVEAVLLPDETVKAPVKIKRPSWIKRPLRAARVAWWRVPPGISTLVSILT